ncbi:hypothetical protein LZ30DRAFT_121986 [Colletotrichum cereale]|nr:hypothetical protein LZ30DRAFT_121986 [Colletotrichum cereale]
MGDHGRTSDGGAVPPCKVRDPKHQPVQGTDKTANRRFALLWRDSRAGYFAPIVHGPWSCLFDHPPKNATHATPSFLKLQACQQLPAASRLLRGRKALHTLPRPVCGAVRYHRRRGREGWCGGGGGGVGGCSMSRQGKQVHARPESRSGSRFRFRFRGKATTTSYPASTDRPVTLAVFSAPRQVVRVHIDRCLTRTLPHGRAVLYPPVWEVLTIWPPLEVVFVS